MSVDCFERKELLALLRKRAVDLKEGYRQNVAVLGSLHVGKSTVLSRFVADLDDATLIPIHLDLENRDIHYLVSKLLRSLLFHFARSKGLPLSDDIRTLATNAQLTLPQTASAVLAVLALMEKGKLAEGYEAALDVLQVFTLESGLYCLMILDEFQALEDMGNEDIFKSLAIRVTTQKKVLYFLASSFEQQARRILSEKLTLLFGNFELFLLEPFDPHASQSFIERRMSETRIGVQLRNFLADFTGGRPLYLGILLQELTNLSAIHKQQEVYAPIVVQGIENTLFYRWGALSRHFELVIDRLCAGKANRLTTDILIELSNGMHKSKDLASLLMAKPSQVNQRLSALVDEDIVERNGTHFHIKDKLLRYWIKYVFQRRIRAVEVEPGRIKKELKDELVRAISEFQVITRQDLSTRVAELLRCFDDEQLSLKGRRYRLPAFRDVVSLKMRQRGGNMGDILQARSDEGSWILVLRKDPVTEADVSVLAEEMKKMDDRPKKCVIVSLSGLDDGARLRALEEQMWIWNEPEVNSLMNLFDKPYIVP